MRDLEVNDSAALQRYLHEHIPLTQAMQVEVVNANWDQVVVSAPLAPNINHRATVFGGSASALAIVAAWSLLHVRLERLGISSHLVIHRNTMEYKRPILDTFHACAAIEDDELWDKFGAILERKQRARISIKVQLNCRDEEVGALEGDFVAIGYAENDPNR